jgi:hypothetical protein
MRVKPTPGPWEVEGEGQDVVGILSVGDNHYIAKLSGWEHTRQDANAHLIAASPDLLEEHRAWARDFGTALLLFLQGDHSAIDTLAHDMIIDQDSDGPILRSPAINKAEGRG